MHVYCAVMQSGQTIVLRMHYFALQQGPRVFDSGKLADSINVI